MSSSCRRILIAVAVAEWTACQAGRSRDAIEPATDNGGAAGAETGGSGGIPPAMNGGAGPSTAGRGGDNSVAMGGAGDAAPARDAGATKDGSAMLAVDAAPAGAILFVRVNAHLSIETSCNGNDWKKPSIEPPQYLGTNEGHGFRSVVQAGGILIATGGGNDSPFGLEKLYTSDDGTTWKARRTGEGDWLSGAGYLETPSGPLWITGGGNGKRLYSRDRGATWREGARGCTLRSMVSPPGRVVAFCDEGTALGVPAPAGAAEPVTWTMQPGNGDGWGRGAYGTGRVVAVWGGATGTPGCKVLVDGTDSWRPCGRGVAEVVMFDDGWFYASIASIQGDARWSQDGLVWSKRPEPAWRGNGTQVAAANGIFVRADVSGLVAARVPVAVCR